MNVHLNGIEAERV